MVSADANKTKGHDIDSPSPCPTPTNSAALVRPVLEAQGAVCGTVSRGKSPAGELEVAVSLAISTTANLSCGCGFKFRQAARPENHRPQCDSNAVARNYRGAATSR